MVSERPRRVPPWLLAAGAMILAVAAGLSVVVPRIDPHASGEWDVDHALVRQRNPLLDSVARFLEFVDGPLFIPWVMLGLVVVGLALRSRILGLLVALVIGGAWLPGHFVKDLVHRARPDRVDAIVVYDDVKSFPSGHAGMAVAFGVGFILVWWLAGHRVRAWHVVVAALWFLLVGASRIYAGAHYPLDVAGGGALALGTGLLLTWPATAAHAAALRRWPALAGGSTPALTR